MSEPRQIIPGRTYLVTRRCSERRFFLRPSKTINQIFAYCVAHAAKIYNINIHAVCVMSNHWHAVLTDTQGNLPDFMAWVHKYVAKCINLHLGRSESLWSSSKYSAQWLPTEAEVIDKMCYVLLNPVKANLVARAKHWPGLTSANMKMGTTVSYKRPKSYFRNTGPLPKQHILAITRPPALNHLSNSELSTLIAQHLQNDESAYAKSRTTPVMGTRSVKKISPYQRPVQQKKGNSRNLALTGKSAAVFFQVLAELKAFRQAYREAFTLFSQGLHSVVFPHGTYKLRKIANVNCAPM